MTTKEEKPRGTLNVQPTVNYEAVLGDYKRNEQMIMSKLDQIQKNASKKKGDKKGMGAAVEATEEIRKWEEHMWDHDKLYQKFGTSRT